MSRDPLPDDRPEDDPPEPEGRLRTTGTGTLVGCLVVGLVGGWALRQVSVMLGGTTPRVSWLQASAFFLVAAILGTVARATRRELQHGVSRLRAAQTVNRLVLAKSCAVTGALVAGGYLGHAISWIGEGELSSERIARSLVAALGAALTVVAALLLERACRVRSDDPRS